MASLREELAELQLQSEERAKQDHDQCVVMFQQMQQLVQMNASMERTCASRSTGDDPASRDDRELERPLGGTGSKSGTTSSEGEQLQRLQAIVVQQAKELELLRRRQRDQQISGQGRPKVAANVGNQHNEEESRLEQEGLDATADEADNGQHSTQSIMNRRNSYLRKLPLTSLHAKLKSKDLQVKHLQQTIAKLETKLEQLIDRKRSLAKNFQQTAREQQAHLKKYLAHIQQQAQEKKELERKVRELNRYVQVLEKKVVSSATKSKRDHLY